MTYPVLYLDYDGPLHDDAVYWHPKRGIYIHTPGRTRFEWMPILESILEPHPTVKIVLSTSWVRVRGYSYVKKRLSWSLQQRIVGATYHTCMDKEYFSSLSRGHQILRDVARRRPSTWLALDNDSDGPDEYLERLILTDDRHGLSDLAVQEILRNRLAQEFL